MAMVPSEIQEQYFLEVFDLINVQARNKCLHVQIENEELVVHMRKLESEREGAVKLKQGSIASTNMNEGDLKMPALSEDHKNNKAAIKADTTNSWVEEEGHMRISVPIQNVSLVVEVIL